MTSCDGYRCKLPIQLELSEKLQLPQSCFLLSLPRRASAVLTCSSHPVSAPLEHDAAISSIDPDLIETLEQYGLPQHLFCPRRPSAHGKACCTRCGLLPSCIFVFDFPI